MALTKPILYSVNAFDATLPQVFTFESIGGDQVVANQLTIINQATGDIVYQRKEDTNAFLHNLPANTLTNGDYYSAQLKTYNSDNLFSIPSASIQFRCYETPSWNFTNIPDGGIINNSTYVFNVRYSQPQFEGLSSVTFNFYDASKNLIDTSTFFVQMSPYYTYYDVVYEVDGLDNTSEYYIQAKGITENSMEIDTGLIYFKVEYEVPFNYNAIELSNECEKGYVTATINAFSINGTSSPKNLKYVSGDTAVLQDSNDNYITWEENFHLSANYRVLLWGRNFYTLRTPNQFTIYITDDADEKIIVFIDMSDNNVYRMTGLIYNSDGEFINTIYSNSLTITNMNLLQQLIIEKNNGVYTLQYKLRQEYTVSSIIGKGIVGVMILNNEGDTKEWTTRIINSTYSTITAPNGAKYGVLQKLGGTSRKQQLIPFPYYEKTKTEGGIRWTMNLDGSININGTTRGDSFYYLVPPWSPIWLPKGTYTISGVTEHFYINAVTSSGTFVKNLQTGNGTFNNSTGEMIEIGFLIDQPETVDTTVYPMLEVGSIIHDFKLYPSDVISAPVNGWTANNNTTVLTQAIFDLCPDYGLGLDANRYNYIDFDTKTYHRKVGSLDLGALTYSMGTNNIFYSDVISNIANSSCICSKYTYHSIADSSMLNKDCKIVGQKFYAKDSEYNTVQKFKDGVTGVTLIFELAQEQIIDLSEVLDTRMAQFTIGSDNLVVFHYPLENNYNIDTPSTIKYGIKLSGA